MNSRQLYQERIESFAERGSPRCRGPHPYACRRAHARCPAACSRHAVRARRPPRSTRPKPPGAPRRARRSSRSRAASAPAAGPSGRRASSSARRSCSSTPPATRDFLELGRARTVERMAPHLTHVGVHDHGFNNVSTYGNLWRLAREGRIDASRLGAALLRAGAEGQRRGPGAALDAAARRRLHLLVQRRALAVRRHDPLAARAGARAPARPSPGRGAGRARSACSSGWSSTRAPPREFSVYYGARPRHLRRARPRRAREPLQRRQRHLPRPEQPAGLLAVHHLDARPGLGDARLRRAARVPRHASPTTSSAPLGGRDGGRRLRCSRRRARPATSTSTTPRAADGMPYWDTGAPGLAALGDWRDRPADPFNDHEPVDSSAAAIAAQGLLRLGRYLSRARRGRRRATRRPACACSTRCSIGRPVPQHRRRAPGPAAPLGLSPAERLGPRARRRARSRAASRASGATTTLREVGALRAAARDRRAVPHLLRRGRRRGGRHDGGDPRAALVTGGTRGIGLGIARALARRGLAAGRQRRAPGGRRRGRRSTSSPALGGGGRTTARPTSRSRGDRARLVAERVDALRRLDALVNNAGRAPAVRADLLEAGEDSFEKLVRTNLQGPYFLTQQVARHMLERGRGAGIVFVTSVSAELASINRGDYCVSKAGLAMAVRLFALRLAARAIPVFEVRPGIIATDMTARVKDVYDRRIADGLVPEGPLGHAGRRRPGGRGAAARRRALRHRLGDPRRRRPGARPPVSE